MRIALDGRTIQDHFPGIARYTFNLALALAEVAPHDELLLLHDPAQHNTRYDWERLRAQPNVRLVTADAPVFALRAQWRVPALLTRARADVYHSPYYLMPYLPRRATVVTMHDLIPLLYPHDFTLVQRVIFNTAVRLAVRAAQRVVAVSQATANDLCKLLGVRAEKIVGIPEAADPTMLRPTDAAIAAMRARYQLPERYVLSLGSNKPHKNLAPLVEAYAQVPARAHTPLVIAGHWDARYPEAQQAAERLALHDAVRWLGAVPSADLPALYGGATLFAFPSLYEGFGLPVLEAMACGAPVVCSNVSSLPEVAGDPSAALLVDPHDVPKWSDALQRALDDADLRAHLAERGTRRAREFSWGRTAQQTLDLYRTLVK